MHANAVRDVVISFDWMPQIGGAHLWLYEVYRRWPGPVEVLTIRPDSVADRASPPEGPAALGSLTTHRRAIPMPELGLASPSCWSRFLRNAEMAATLAGTGSAAFHCLRAFPEGFVGLLGKRGRSRIRMVTYAHGEEVLVARSSRYLQWMARRVYAGSDLVIANSESTRRLVASLCPQARVRVIHPGVDVGAFVVSDEERQAFRRRLPWGPGTVVVSTVARMERRKNQGAVIEAVARLGREGLRIAYVCAGDGVERGALEALTKAHDAEDRVLFPGAVSDQEKRLILAGSDIHAMPSIRAGEMIEGFGIAFLEAAAAGIPSVSGSNGGQPEAVIDGVTGLVVDGRDPERVCDALRRLAIDPVLRREMGGRARLWAGEHDWLAVRDRIAGAVDSIG